MEFKINKKRLENVVAILNNYVEKKDNTSTNSNILIIVENDFLLLRASDSEIGLEYKISAEEIVSCGQALINAKRLSDILRGLEGGLICFKKLEKTIKISQEKTNYTLPLIANENFIFIENEENKMPILISANELSKGLKMINSAIENSVESYQFNCCYIDIEPEKISFVGSDSKRVNVFTFNAKNENSLQIIINKKAVNEVLKLLNEEVRIYKNETYLIIENDNFKFFARLAALDFLKYKEVMPHRESMHAIELKNADFLAQMKKINAVCEKCNICFSFNHIVFKNHDNNETAVNSEMELPLRLEEDFDISVNNKYIMDFLNYNDFENFVFKYYAAGMPVIFESENFLSLMAVNKN